MRPFALLLVTYLWFAASQVLSASPSIIKPGLPGIQRPFFQIEPLAEIPIAKHADWLAVTPDGVWVAGAEPNAVHRIDPATNRDSLSVSLPGEACAGLAAGFGSLWVPICGARPSVVRIDLKSGRLVASLDVGPAEEGGIATSDDSVWFTIDAAGTLVRVDPKTNKVRQRISIASESHNPIVAAGVVWITSVSHDLVTAVNARTGEVLGTTPTGPQPRFLAAGAGSIWTLNQGDGSVTRIDADTRQQTATVALGIPGSGGDLAFDGSTVWASVIGVPLTAIDPSSNAATIQLIGPGGDALRYGHNSLWLTDYRSGTLTRLDPRLALTPPHITPALVGTWRLVRYVDTPENGAPIEEFGPNPVGQFIFTNSGHVAMSLMRNPPDLAKPTVGIDPDACVPAWYCSYFGTYTVDSRSSRWVTHVLGGNIPSYIGTYQLRNFELNGDVLTINESYSESGRTVRALRVLVREGR